MSDLDAFNASLEQSFAALRADLLAEGGPRISTMRNYRFAILPYDPAREFDLRRHVQSLSNELRREGWSVLSISLNQVLLDRIDGFGDRTIERFIEAEKRFAPRGPDAALTFLESRFNRALQGPDGVASDIIKLIEAFSAEHDSRADKTLVWLGRAGGLYPFIRTSALLKYLDGKTQNLPVVLLYPGTRKDVSALSFMGELPADRDYRPRIY